MTSTLLLPELAREIAGSNRRVAESLATESRRLEDLQQEMNEPEALRKRAARSAQGATTATLSRNADIAGVWQRTLEILEDGLAGDQAKELLQNVLDIIDSWLGIAQKSRDIWRLATALGNSAEGLAELDAAEQEAKRVRTAVEKMQVFFSRTRQPLDVARLEKGRADVAEGRFKNPEQMRSGLGGANT
jgi:hypothetical protein